MVPTSVIVPPATTSVTFGVTTTTVFINSSATITATYNNSSASTNVNLITSVLSSLVCNPSLLGPNDSTTCTVTLAQDSPVGGGAGVAQPLTVNLTSTSSALTFPANIVIPAWNISAAFNVTAGNIGSDSTATLVATLGGLSQTAILTLSSTPFISSFMCDSGNLAAGSSSSCTITMSKSAGNIVVNLSSSNRALTVPATVTVPRGALKASFTATAQSPASGGITVTAFFAGSNSARPFTFNTSPSTGTAALNRVACTPKTLTPGTHGACWITLDNVEGSGGAELQLASSSASVQLPGSIRTRPGQTAVEFQVDAISPGEGIVVAASLGAEVVQETLSVTPDPSKPIRLPERQFVKYGTDLRFQVSPEDPAARISADALPAGARFDSATGEFRWTPAAADIGAHTVNFVAVDSAGRKTAASVPIEVEAGNPVATRIVNAASRSQEAVCSPGAIAAIEGRWFINGAVSDASGSSAELAATKVLVNGAALPVLATSATELDVLCPDAVPGSEIQFVVYNDRGTADPLTTTVRSTTPGIFSLNGTGGGQGWILLKDTNGLATVRNRQLAGQPAMPGDRVLVYATGIDRLANISMEIGAYRVTPASIDAVPNHPGLFQLAVDVPDIAGASGDFPLSLFGDSPEGANLQSNILKIAVETKNQ